jgi:HSP20 family molecular chaperone IbpA
MFTKSSLRITAACIFLGGVSAIQCADAPSAGKKAPPPVVAAPSEDSLLVEMGNLMERQSREMGSLFDRYFGEKFFTSHNDPFAELDTWQKKTKMNADTSFRNYFDDYWGSWYEDRFGTEGIQVSTQNADGKLILDVSVPGVNADAVSVDVNAKRIRLEYNIRKVNEGKDAKGKVISRTETERRMIKVLPTPQNVNAGNIQIIRSGSQIKIEFPRKV